MSATSAAGPTQEYLRFDGRSYAKLAQSHVPDVKGSAVRAETRINECLHFVLGMGLGWLMAPALAVETASLELTQPEGLALGATLTTMGTVAATLIVPVFYSLQQTYRWTVDGWVRAALLMQTLSLLLAAVAAHATIGGRVSWALHVSAFLGSFAANLQRLAAMPWVMRSFPSTPSCVSWLLAGGNFSSLSCAFLGFIQQPGEGERFSVNMYFLVLQVLVVASAAAFLALFSRRRRSSKLEELHDAVHVSSVHGIYPAHVSVWCALPDFAWHPEVMVCVFTNALVQFICWIVLGFLLPFAAAQAAAVTDDLGLANDVSSKGTLLGYATELSTVAVFAGSVVSAWLSVSSLHCGFTLASMCACLLIVVGFVTGSLPSRLPNPHGEAGVLLVLAAATARFVDGLVTPLLYRRAAVPFPVEQRQDVTQYQGSVSIAFTALSTWVLVGTIALMNR
eukprot:scaffold315517_cov36-Tisochrysis_lutea.AAC.1